MTPRLKELYNKEIKPALKTQFGLKNLYMGPKIEKVILNMGLGEDALDDLFFDLAMEISRSGNLESKHRGQASNSSWTATTSYFPK